MEQALRSIESTEKSLFTQLLDIKKKVKEQTKKISALEGATTILQANFNRSCNPVCLGNENSKQRPVDSRLRTWSLDSQTNLPLGFSSNSQPEEFRGGDNFEGVKGDEL